MIGSGDNSRVKLDKSGRDRQAFSDLLLLAEKISIERQKLSKEFDRRVGRSFIAILSVGLSVATSLYLVGDKFPFRTEVFLGLLLFCTSALYVTVSHAWLTFKRLDKRERLAFEQVMSITHEVLEGLKSEMTPLELAEIRIRMLRLDN